jgi:alpha-amylase/alpha-mannosidase (GH57 family)
MNRFVCIHGHFYQPPRENPWLETVELQESAKPFHDWNERITAECYAPNTASRYLNDEDQIVEIANNYSRISFNFGPTLLAWLERSAPWVYGAIQEADWVSQKQYAGHGSALCQAYHHSILPLSNSRDKRTEITWGIRDFQHRFNRHPEGMWLPETAVDLETLDFMSQHGIAFTILSPYQALRTRRENQKDWSDASEGRVDPKRPYRVNLPSGREIVVFFYDGPISRAVAFERLLNRGENFARRLVGGFSVDTARPQMLHIATDGETYGHHHRHGEMALTYALRFLEKNKLARITNYGEFLNRFPPAHLAEIQEMTSWSCSHGVERWRSHCGCHTGGRPEWSQAWRTPLREALDSLRDRLAVPFEREAGRLLEDPWEARDDYISVILDRSSEGIEKFFARHARQPLRQDQQIQALRLMELQRHALLMYTSCGWFFNDISGIETVQILKYAGRALQLASVCFDEPFEETFLRRLQNAASNDPAEGDGRSIYLRKVKPAQVGLPDVAAHFAITSLFESVPDESTVHCYTVNQTESMTSRAGKSRLAGGLVRVESQLTREAADFIFSALHLGDHNISCGVHPYDPEKIRTEEFLAELFAEFSKADLTESLRVLDRIFPGETYSLKSLFGDEKRRLLDHLLESTIQDVELQYRQIYERQAPLMRYLAEIGAAQPRSFQMAAEFVINSALRRAFRDQEQNLEHVKALLKEAESGNIELEEESLGFELTALLERLAAEVVQEPEDLTRIARLHSVVRLSQQVPFRVNLWTVQNQVYRILQSHFPRMAAENSDRSGPWLDEFHRLSDLLRLRVGRLLSEEGADEVSPDG